MERARTDDFVRTALKELKLNYDEQKSRNPDICDALKNASKSGKGGSGYPEFFVYYPENSKYLIVIEDKEDNNKLVKYTDDGDVDLTTGKASPVSMYAVNGAVHYANSILAKTSKFDVIIALGVTGDFRTHNILAFAVTRRGVKNFGSWQNFEMLRFENISDLIDTKIYNKPTKDEILEKNIIKIANELNEDLRKYGQVQEHWKPLIISGLVLALKDPDFEQTYGIILRGEKIGKTKNYSDGSKIYDYIEKTLRKSSFGMDQKIQLMLAEFSFIKDDLNLNNIHDELQETPLKYITRKVHEKVYQTLANHKYDILGKFYSRFLKYASGSDSSALGEVLTPGHITEAFCRLSNLNEKDTIIDPCTGTGGFLVSSMNYMIDLIKNNPALTEAEKSNKILNLKSNQLYGIENKRNLFTVATTNMILRGDGKSNLMYEDCFKVNSEVRTSMHATVGMMNPPYSLAKKLKDAKFSEWNFILNMLDMLEVGGRGLAIVPLSVPVGQTEYEILYKKEFLSKHTLDAVITMPAELFYPVGTHTCIMIFKAKIPHPTDHRVKFINFDDDACIKHKTLGRITTRNTAERMQFLYDVYFDKIDVDKTVMIKAKLGESGLGAENEEWIYSYHYFDETIPDDDLFKQKILEYVKFKTKQILEGREGLFEE